MGKEKTTPHARVSVFPDAAMYFKIQPLGYRPIHHLCVCFFRIINIYFTKLSKIWWFAIGEQTNFLPKSKAKAKNRPARHQQVTIFCENPVKSLFIIRWWLNLFSTSQPSQAQNSSFWCIFEICSCGWLFLRGVWDSLCIKRNVWDNHRSSKIVLTTNSK